MEVERINLPIEGQTLLLHIGFNYVQITILSIGLWVEINLNEQTSEACYWIILQITSLT